MRKLFFGLLLITMLLVTGCASSQRAVSRVTEPGIGINASGFSDLLKGSGNVPMVEDVYPNLEQKAHPALINTAAVTAEVAEKVAEEKPPTTALPEKPMPQEVAKVSELVTFPTQGRAKELANKKLPYQLQGSQSLVSYPIQSDDDFTKIIQALLHSPLQPILLVSYNNFSADPMRNFRRELGMAGIDNNFFVISNVISTDGRLGELVCIK